jgi:hypothetical protein
MRAAGLWIGALLCLVLPEASTAAEPFERTETRAKCNSYEPLRQPFFGETHVHTSFSFDAYVFSIRNDPNTAYKFAKGAPIKLPDLWAVAGEPQTRTARLKRPLDFAAVTDHAELFGPMQICTRAEGGTSGSSSVQCRQMQTGQLTPGNLNPFGVVAEWSINPILRPNGAGPLLPLCGREGVDCNKSEVSVWKAIQDAAESHYDRSSDCSFTTFVAYEYTAQPKFANLHRNVIFRTKEVVDSPISNVTTDGPYPTRLWNKLREQCLGGKKGCDVLTIPHNANVSGGLMFPDPANVQEARERALLGAVADVVGIG